MKNYLKLVVGAVLFVSAGSAFAVVVPPDFTAIVTATDVSTVGTAILAISAVLALPLVIKKGAKMVLHAIH